MRRLLILSFLLLPLLNIVNAKGIDQVYRGNSHLSFGQLISNAFNLSNYNKSYAVVVGISDYDGGFTNLPSTRNDAIRMKNFLINEAGFDHVHLITEEKATFARLQNVMVDKMPSLIKSNDRFVFYWSGHGVTRKVNNRPLGYLPLQQSSIDSYSTMLRMKALADWDDALIAKQTLYLLDACFSGLAGFATKGRRNQTIQQIARPSRQILTAGLPHEETIASPTFGGSLFTTAIIDGLKGEADSSFGRYKKDGIISAKELELYTKQRVNEEVRRRQLRRQLTPSLLNLPGGPGDFFFVNNDYAKDVNSEWVITKKSRPVRTKNGVNSSSIETIGHFHAANQYSDALNHSHPGGGVSHPHNYNKARIQAQPLHSKVVRDQAEISRQFIEPVMINIPAGRYIRGCLHGREKRTSGVCETDEYPSREVYIPAFMIGKTEVTFNEWDACAKAGVCTNANDEGWGRGKRPVINVSLNDIAIYTRWLNQQTGKHYQLPSEAQWEYVARSNSNKKFSWGNSISCNNANYGACAMNQTKSVASYPANAFGIHDTSGNVWEWVEDCWRRSYLGAPSNGEASKCNNPKTSRVLRGCSWSDGEKSCRLSYRLSHKPSLRMKNSGFRLALMR